MPTERGECGAQLQKRRIGQTHTSSSSEQVEETPAKRSRVQNMTRVTVEFTCHVHQSNPDEKAILIIGPRHALTALKYKELRPKFAQKISEEFFENVQEVSKTCSSDIIPIYMKNVTMIRLPSSCSRYNTPSQAHALTKFVKSQSTGHDEYIVLLCEESDLVASAAAIARAYPIYSKKRQNNNPVLVQVEVMIINKAGARERFIYPDEARCMNSIGDSVRMAAKIVDSPCSDMNTDDFLQEIAEVGKALSIVPKIIRGDDLDKQGFGGLFSVGKAAEHPPALAILSHIVPTATETIAWVGKGIVYDTGGLFIKPRSSMLGMKRDCGGAAAILGAFYHSVKMGFSQNLHAVFCLAENAVGPKATRPDDIITLYSGKTVEVSNTDAEGRLVLGDGVAYAKKDLQATTILDMATLTGAQGVSTGRYHAALVTNSEKWEKLTVEAGKLSGDLIHPMPYAPEIHFSEFNSSLADMKNSTSDNSNAMVSCAGLFIGSHIGFDFEGDWLHVDMAKTSYTGERATGYGVVLLTVLFSHFSKHRLMRNLSPNLSAKEKEDLYA